MRRFIGLVSIAIFVFAFASLLGGYTRGFGIPLDLSEVAAQEDHDDGGDSFDDGHDDGGDTYDDGHDDGGDTFDDGHDDGGDSFDDGHDGGGDTFDDGHDGGGDTFDDGHDATGIDQHIDDDGEFIGGTEVFIGNNFQVIAGGMVADIEAGLFLDSATGQIFDVAGIQFYDPDTGEPIDLDLESEQYANGDFTYGYIPEVALGFQGHIVGGTDIIVGGDYQTAAGGIPFDVATGRFLDPSSNQVFDTNGVRFFDLETGEPLEFDVTAEWYTRGEFDYQFVPEAALGYRSQSVAGLVVFLGGEFEQNAGGMSVDPNSGLFFDPGTGQIFDDGGVQFFNPDTGEPLEFDLGSDWYAQGDFTYEYRPGTAVGFKPRVNLGFRSEEALLAYNDASQLTPDDFAHEGADFAHKIAQDLDHQGFQDLGSDAVFGLMEAMEDDHFNGLESSQKASIFAAMNGIQILEIDPSDVAAVAAAMSSQDYSLLDSDSAFGIFSSIGIDKSLDLEADSLAGMVGAFEGSQFHELGGDQVSEIVGGLNYKHLAGLGNEQALNMALEMNSGHFNNLNSGQISGLTEAIDAKNIGELDGSVLEAVVTGLNAEDLSALGNEKVGEIFVGVTDKTIVGLPVEQKEAALEALDANYLDSSVGTFGDVPATGTVVDLVDLETPPSILSLKEIYASIRNINSIGCASDTPCQGAISYYDLTIDAGPGGTVSPNGTNNYPADTLVTVTATPDPGFVFLGWSGGCSSDGACTLTMDDHLAVTATFVALDDHGNDFLTATRLIPDAAIPGNIETGQDLDFFSFPAESGKSYKIEAILETLPNSNLELFDSSGNLIIQDTGVLSGSRINHRADETGPLYVAVSGLSTLQTGTYILSVKEDTDPLTFTPGTLDPAKAGVPYHYSLCQTEPEPGLFCGGPLEANPPTINPIGGSPHYTFSIGGIGLPFGLSLNFHGLISGTPAAKTPTGWQFFTVCVEDQADDRVCREARIFVEPDGAPTPSTWKGIYDSSHVRPSSGCSYNNEGPITMAVTIDGDTISGTANIGGVTIRWVPGCRFAFKTTGEGSVTGTIEGETWTLRFKFDIGFGSLSYLGTGTRIGNTVTGDYVEIGSVSSSSGAFTLSLQ